MVKTARAHEFVKGVRKRFCIGVNSSRIPRKKESCVVNDDIFSTTDSVDGPISPTATHSSGDSFAVGTTTVTYTFTDSDTNSSTCIFDVIVADNEAPVVSGALANINQNVHRFCLPAKARDDTPSPRHADSPAALANTSPSICISIYSGIMPSQIRPYQ